MGSIRDEWKAWETVSFLVLMPVAENSAPRASTASPGPEIRILSGPLMAAMETPWAAKGCLHLSFQGRHGDHYPVFWQGLH